MLNLFRSWLIIVNWQYAKTKYASIIASNGVFIQWLQRSIDLTDAYNTGSTSTYGYSDPVITWTTGSQKAVIEHLSATDKLIEAGFRAEHYERVYVDPDSNITFWEQIIFPSGSSVRYIVLPEHIQRMSVGDTVVAKFFIMRLLIAKSGSTF